MKNHELLDLIGEVDEDYVLAAGDNVTRPRFGWKKLAACAACAALVLCAYPVYRLAAGGANSECYALHGYTVMEGGGTLDTQADVKLPAGGVNGQAAFAPDIIPGGAYVSGEAEDDAGYESMDGIGYNVPGQDAPSQEVAQAQYNGLLQGLGGQWGYEPETYPDWYGGAWIDNSYYPEAKLAVAIVDGFRTAELEAQIKSWCGGEIVFTDAKYSLEHLNSLMDPAVESAKGTGLSCGIGIDLEENCLTMDLYSLSGEPVPDRVLATLATLDPAGDAIRVRVFVEKLSLADDAVKGPTPPDQPADAAVFDGAWAEPIDPTEFSVPEEKPVPNEKAEPNPAPGTVQFAEELPEVTETERPAYYGLLPHDE